MACEEALPLTGMAGSSIASPQGFVDPFSPDPLSEDAMAGGSTVTITDGLFPAPS